MKKGKNECSCNSLLIALMLICALLSLTTLGIVMYDRYIKSNNTCDSNNATCHQCYNK